MAKRKLSILFKVFFDSVNWQKALLAPSGFAPDLLRNREHDETVEEAATAAVSAANSTGDLDLP